MSISSLIPTHYTYNVADGGGKQLATCQIHRYCDIGIVYSMLGTSLLESLFIDLVSGKLKEIGLFSLEGYVLDDVLPAIEYVVGIVDGVKVTFSKRCDVDGFRSTWVKVERV